MTNNDLKLRATKRVERKKALQLYKYVLIDDPFLYGPTIYEYKINQQEYDQYYLELLKKSFKKIRELGSFKNSEFKDDLNYRLSEKEKEFKVLLSKNLGSKSVFKEVGMQIYQGKKALEENRLKDAGEYVFHIIRNLERNNYDYHQKPLIKIGKETLAALEKGRLSKYGSKGNKERFVEYVKISYDTLHKECPLMPTIEATKTIAKDCKKTLGIEVTYKTIERIIKPKKNSKK